MALPRVFIWTVRSNPERVGPTVSGTCIMTRKHKWPSTSSTNETTMLHCFGNCICWWEVTPSLFYLSLPKSTDFCARQRESRRGSHREQKMGVCGSRPKVNEEDLSSKKKNNNNNNHRRRRRRILRRRVSSRKIEANNVSHSNSALQASNRASGTCFCFFSLFFILFCFKLIVLVYFILFF